MNKFLSLAAACTLALGFTACEDVPAPYGLPTEKQQQQPASKEVLLEESFASSLGSFKNYTTSGEGAWKIDFKTAKASPPRRRRPAHTTLSAPKSTLPA